MTMTECKNCGVLASKTQNLIHCTVNCECGTYTEDIMIEDPVKTVYYNRQIMDYSVGNRDDFSWRNNSNIEPIKWPRSY